MCDFSLILGSWYAVTTKLKQVEQWLKGMKTNGLILQVRRELIALLMGTINYCLAHFLITCGQGRMSISLIKMGLFIQRHAILFMCIYNWAPGLGCSLLTCWVDLRKSVHLQMSPSLNLKIIHSQKVANLLML